VLFSSLLSPYIHMHKHGYKHTLTHTQAYTNACNRARARDLFAITQACILVIAQKCPFLTRIQT
jgi:hypothetical protein